MRYAYGYYKRRLLYNYVSLNLVHKEYLCYTPHTTYFKFYHTVHSLHTSDSK